MSGVGLSRLPIASKKLILNHLSELMVKIWSEIAAASGEDLVWKQLAGLAPLCLAFARRGAPVW